MKRLKDENGAVQIIEATIIYPVVFMCIFFLIYVGLYIIQSMTLNSCAQKVAVIAAREIAYPGYIDLVDNKVYKTGAVEADFEEKHFGGGTLNLGVVDIQIPEISKRPVKINCNFNTTKVQTDAYRYWKSDPLSNEAKEVLTNIIQSQVISQSVLGNGHVNVEITCNKQIISQYVTVKINQDVMDIGVLEFFGIKSPKCYATATATVSDNDELIRNADFVVQAIDGLARKLGIDIDKMKETIDNALETIGLK